MGKKVNFVKKNKFIYIGTRLGIFMTHKIKPIGKHANPPIQIDEKRLQKVADATGLSPEFLSDVIKSEGFKTKQYSFGGIKYIGIGHNMNADPKCQKHSKCPKTISEEQVYDIFKEDLLAARERIDRYTNKKFSSLNQGQREALIDISFNVKPSVLKKSALVKDVSEGKTDKAVKELGFVTANGKVLPGACKRRIRDIYLFAKQTPSKAAIEAVNDILQKASHLSPKQKRWVRNTADVVLRKLKEAMEFQKAARNFPENPYGGLIVK